MSVLISGGGLVYPTKFVCDIISVSINSPPFQSIGSYLDAPNLSFNPLSSIRKRNEQQGELVGPMAACCLGALPLIDSRRTSYIQIRRAVGAAWWSAYTVLVQYSSIAAEHLTAAEIQFSNSNRSFTAHGYGDYVDCPIASIPIITSTRTETEICVPTLERTVLPCLF